VPFSGDDDGAPTSPISEWLFVGGVVCRRYRKIDGIVNDSSLFDERFLEISLQGGIQLFRFLSVRKKKLIKLKRGYEASEEETTNTETQTATTIFLGVLGLSSVSTAQPQLTQLTVPQQHPRLPNGRRN